MKLLQYFQKMGVNVPSNFDFKPIKRLMLGRWALTTDDKCLKKVDLTNEDHCGGCNTLREDYLEKSKELRKMGNTKN